MKKQLIFLSGGDSITFDNLCTKYPEEIKKLREHYEITSIDYLKDDINILNSCLKNLEILDIVIKDLTVTSYEAINNIGYVSRDLFPYPCGGEFDTYIMSGDSYNFKELFEYIGL